MTVPELRLGDTQVNQEAARIELSRFFTIAETVETAPEMFSAYIDAEWHRLLGSAEYEELCRTAVGRPVGHRADVGRGTPSWLESYHERYGVLPAVWFADADGVVDRELHLRYLAAWGAPAGRAPELIVAWDCTPTTNDDDYRPPR